MKREWSLMRDGTDPVRAKVTKGQGVGSRKGLGAEGGVLSRQKEVPLQGLSGS